jgi:hypothetical protein
MFLRDRKTAFYNFAGNIVKTNQALRINVQRIREWNVSHCLQSKWYLFDEYAT